MQANVDEAAAFLRDETVRMIGETGKAAYQTRSRAVARSASRSS